MEAQHPFRSLKSQSESRVWPPMPMVVAAIGSILCAATGCGGETDGAAAACEPGTERACGCRDGSTSVQVCEASGDTAFYLPCRCGDGSGAAGGAGGSGGTDIAGGAGGGLPPVAGAAAGGTGAAGGPGMDGGVDATGGLGGTGAAGEPGMDSGLGAPDGASTIPLSGNGGGGGAGGGAAGSAGASSSGTGGAAGGASEGPGIPCGDGWGTALIPGNVELGLASNPEIAGIPGGTQDERMVFDQLNAERINHGLQALSWSEQVANVARSHAADMNQLGYFDHGSSTRPYRDASDQVIRGNWLPLPRLDFVYPGDFSRAGENIAMMSPAMAVPAWMDSEGHRAAILDEYGWPSTHGAIGIDGRMIVFNPVTCAAP